MKSRNNEIFLSVILLLGIAAFGAHSYFYREVPLWTMISNTAFLLAVSVPFILYILFVTRKERNFLLDKIFVNKLTGLPNREKLRVDAKHPHDILFLINIDSFKEFNDFYGYKIGDYIIQEMAVRLKKLIRKRDSSILKYGILYKLGTDEYAILIHHDFGRGEVIKAADSIARCINEDSFFFQNHEMSVTATIGIAFGEQGDNDSFPDTGTPGILAKADMALKTAKTLNYHYLIYDNSMQIPKTYEDNIRWTKKLKDSIKRDRVVSYFQPIVNNQTGIIEKYECLIRIVDDDSNIIYPNSFLKISKRSRLYPELTRIMVNYALEQATLFPDIEFSINISVEDIQNPETVGYIYEKLLEKKNSAPRVCFEILETEYIESIDTVKDFINEVKKTGCSIAIDDFGFGYSNLSYLLELNVDYIKIDSSLIKNLDTNKNAVFITETIVSFCRKLNIRTVAEFVHSQDIYIIVKNMGIDFSQGYYFGKPYHEPFMDKLDEGESLII